MSHVLIIVASSFIRYAPSNLNLFLNFDCLLRQSWTAPIQMIICLILLLLDLGPSAIAGFAFFFLVPPFQTYFMKRISVIRHKSMLWTDKRSKLLQELLSASGMKVIKFFAWELPFLERISGYRHQEMA